jgi:sphingolipid delta-4 desaturase
MNDSLTFTRTTTGEPHAARRRRLIAAHPEIRALAGFDRRTAWVTLAVSIAQLSIAAIVSRGHLGALAILALGWMIGAPLTHWLSMAIHETSHRLAARTRHGNSIVAMIANLPMVLPVAFTFNRYHIDHHRYLDVLGKDTDLPLPIEVRLVGRSRFRKLVWLFFYPVVYIARGATFAKRPNVQEIATGVFMVLVDAAIVIAFGWSALAYLAVAFWFAHGLHPVAAHFLHEHYTFAEDQETCSYYGPINYVAFNVGFHNEHHDFMNISGWRLPELRKMIPEYDTLVSHPSWTNVLYRFITDDSMGFDRRIVRTEHDFWMAAS